MGKISWKGGSKDKTTPAMYTGRTSSCKDMKNALSSTFYKSRQLLLHIFKLQPTDWSSIRPCSWLVILPDALLRQQTHRKKKRIRSERIWWWGMMEFNSFGSRNREMIQVSVAMGRKAFRRKSSWLLGWQKVQGLWIGSACKGRFLKPITYILFPVP